MDNVLNIDNVEMIKTLGFLHDNVKPITHNVVSYIEDNKLYIVDLNDRPIIVGDVNTILVRGTFAIVCDTFISTYMEDKAARIVNLLTFKEMNTFIQGSADILNVGDEFLLLDNVKEKRTVSYLRRKALYNKNLERLYTFESLSMSSRTVKVRDDVLKVNMQYFYDGYWKSMILNKESARIEVFDSLELNEKEDISIFGVEWSKDDSLSINSKVIGNVRYRLCTKGKQVGKAYLDINKPQELSNSDYFMVYDICHVDYTGSNKKVSRQCKGLIDSTGRELIQPIYDDIKYIGNYTFVLIFCNAARIFSFVSGLIFDNIPADNVWIHPTLPITVVMEDTSCWILDTYGRKFAIVDIAKYFECYATQEDNDVLKINTGYKFVYVSRKLVPITNIHSIAKLMTYEWFRI